MPKPLSEGSKAPPFRLPTDGGGEAALKDYAGRILVLYFYPKDDTDACTREAVAFSQAARAFSRSGADILGVSKDAPARHDAFKAKHDLSIRLASDEKGDMLERYGVWIEKILYGRKYMGIDRSTFLIDRTGVIRRIWRKVRVPGHVDEVLGAVNAL